MKDHYILFLFLLSTIPLWSQTTTFEDWETVGDFEIPVGWEVNNVYISDPVSVMEEEGYEGKALRLTSRGPTFEGFAPGTATAYFDLNLSVENFRFQYRVDSLIEGGFARVELYSSQDDYTELIGEWESAQLSDDFAEVTIPVPLSSEDYTMKVLLISGTTAGPLGFEGYTEWIIDNVVREGVIGSTANIGELPFETTPNPARDLIQVSLPDRMRSAALALFNAAGQLCWQGQQNQKMADHDLSSLPAGYYLLRVRSQEQQGVQPLVIID